MKSLNAHHPCSGGRLEKKDTGALPNQEAWAESQLPFWECAPPMDFTHHKAQSKHYHELNMYPTMVSMFPPMAQGLIWTYMQHREQHTEHHNVLICVKDILMLHLG